MADDYFEIDLGVSFPLTKIGIVDENGTIVKKIATADMNEYLGIESTYKKKGYREVHQPEGSPLHILFIPKQASH